MLCKEKVDEVCWVVCSVIVLNVSKELLEVFKLLLLFGSDLIVLVIVYRNVLNRDFKNLDFKYISVVIFIYWIEINLCVFWEFEWLLD